MNPYRPLVGHLKKRRREVLYVWATKIKKQLGRRLLMLNKETCENKRGLVVEIEQVRSSIAGVVKELFLTYLHNTLPFKQFQIDSKKTSIKSGEQYKMFLLRDQQTIKRIKFFETRYSFIMNIKNKVDPKL